MAFGPLKSLLSLACALILLPVAAPTHAQIVVSDPNFAASDWSATVYFTSGGGATHGESAPGSGGNPGAFRSMTHAIPPSSSFGVLHEFLPYTYSPSVSGPLDSLTYSEDRVEFNPPFAGAAIGANPALVQGGVAYFGPNITFSNTTWQTVRLRSLTAASFTSANATHPDFGSTGGPIRFGFARSNTSTATGFGTLHGIDNWSYSLYGPALVAVPAGGPPSHGTMRVRGANPGSGQIVILMSRAAPRRAVVAVHDLSGRRIRTLADREFPAGTSELAWDAHDERGARVIEGIYFVAMRAEGEMQTVKVVVTR